MFTIVCKERGPINSDTEIEKKKGKKVIPNVTITPPHSTSNRSVGYLDFILLMNQSFIPGVGAQLH